MNNPEEIKMGLDATGFNPNIQQAKPVNNTKIANVEKTAIVQKAPEVTNIDVANKVNVNFNVGKTSSKELKNVTFEHESVGKATMKSVADSIDIAKGSIMEAAKAILEAIRN